MNCKKTFRNIVNTAAAATCMAVLTQCAAVGTPDGGAYDETPPRVTGSSPKMEATGVKSKKVTIDFSEFIKLEKASEKVVYSPPQLEQPEIKVNGKKIQIEFIDSLKPGTTYSIDFSDGIVDNNEGNPLGDFCFRFSTGDSIDTLEVSGYVLNAEDLEPVAGITVGLHSDLSDSAFLKKPFDRVSRTDSKGHFTVRGIAPGRYRIFAVQDMDGSYSYSARNELVAWSDSVIIPSSFPDVRTDSIFSLEGTFDSLATVNYTHYLPDDIVLLASLAKPDNQYLAKYERDSHEKATVQFSLPMDSMPEIKWLDCDCDSSYVLQHSVGFDTLTFWFHDTLVYYRDTLSMSLTYLGTDTAGVLSLRTDTIQLTPKKLRANILKEKEKQEAEKKEELEKKLKKLEKDGDTLAIKELLKPEPMRFLPVKADAGNSLSAYKQIRINFDEPVTFVSDTAVHVFEKHDSLWDAVPFEFMQDSTNILSYKLNAEWKPGQSYRILMDSASIYGIWGLHNNRIEENLSFSELDKFSTFTVNIVDPKPGYTVGLISNKKIARTAKWESGTGVDFFLVTPGDYYVFMYDDANGNGIWDAGDYYNSIQPEPVYYMNRKFTLKADWYHETEPWNIFDMPLFKQKPDDLTDSKEKKSQVDTHKKNVERLEKKATQIKAQEKKKEEKKQERQKRRENFKALFDFQ